MFLVFDFLSDTLGIYIAIHNLVMRSWYRIGEQDSQRKSRRRFSLKRVVTQPDEAMTDDEWNIDSWHVSSATDMSSMLTAF